MPKSIYPDGFNIWHYFQANVCCASRETAKRWKNFEECCENIDRLYDIEKLFEMSVELDAMKRLFVTKEIKGEFERLVMNGVKYVEAEILSKKISEN